MMQRQRSTLATTRILSGSLAAGVVLFWIVCVVLTGGGSAGIAPDLPVDPGQAFGIWSAVALAGFSGALYFRGRTVEIAARARRPGSREPAPDVDGRVQTYLILAGSLLEVGGLLAGVALLLGAAQVLWVAAPVYAIGVAVTFPRDEWFGESGRSAVSR